MAEPGQFPTLRLRLLTTLRAAAPGAILTLRVDGTDAHSLVRGFTVGLERRRGGEWSFEQVVDGGTSATVVSRGSGAGSALWGHTMTHRPGTEPMYVRVPNVQAGDYRLRLDLVNDSSLLRGPDVERTATLYAPLRVLARRPAVGTPSS